MTKYLDDKGLKTFTTKMKDYADGKVNAVDRKVTSHIDNIQNPHGVTKTQIGLSNVTNKEQIPLSEKGAINGVATLDAKGKVPVAQMPETKTINGKSIFGSGNLTVSTSLYEIVDALPTKNIDISKIYLVPAATTADKNNKTEYIYLGDPSKAYDATKWEKLGEEQKSATIETPGGSIVVDTAFNASSSNPIANKTVALRLNTIEDTLNGKVAQEEYKTAMGTVNSKLETLENNTITVDTELKDSINPVQNKAVNSAVQKLNNDLNAKADTTALTNATGRITVLEKNGATGVTESGEGNGIASIKKVGKDIIATKGTFITSLVGYATTATMNTELSKKAEKEHTHSQYALNSTLENYALNSTLADYATRKWVGDQGFAKGTIPTKVGELQNDSGFLTSTSLAGYVNDVNITEVTNGNGIASISKDGSNLNVTQGAFLTGMPNGTLYEEGTGNGIVDIFLRGTVLCKRKGNIITNETLKNSINDYASEQGYLTKENIKENMKETVVIKLVSDKSDSDTGLIGATVTVKSGDTTVSTQTWQGSPISVDVMCDRDVTIEVGTVKMYMKPKALTYAPSPLYNRKVTFTYKALSLGTYIIDKNDNLYKTTDLFQASGVAYDDALGVLLVTDSIAIVIARTVLNEKAWSTGTGLVEGCTTTTDSYSTAIKDFAGAANTAAIIKKHNALDEAAASCNRYIFKNGKKGYLMSAGEALAIQANIDTIGRLLVDIDTGNGNVMSSSNDYWTSTQYDASKAYYVRMSSIYLSNSNKENKKDVVPIYSLYD